MIVTLESLGTVFSLLVILAGALSVVIGLRVTYNVLKENARASADRLNDHGRRIGKLETRVAVVEMRSGVTQ